MKNSLLIAAAAIIAIAVIGGPSLPCESLFSKWF